MTSSPKYQQSNGAAEAAVKIAKGIIKKCNDISEGLLAYRSTPLENGYSPAELMFSRKIRTTLPIVPTKLGTFKYHSKVVQIENKRKEKQAVDYNRRHRSGRLATLGVNDAVWIIDLRVYGHIVKVLDAPNSFSVRTERGSLIKRNRWHLVPAPYRGRGIEGDGRVASGVGCEPIDVVEDGQDASDRREESGIEEPSVQENGGAVQGSDSPTGQAGESQGKPRRACGPPQFYGNIVTH